MNYPIQELKDKANDLAEDASDSYQLNDVTNIKELCTLEDLELSIRSLNCLKTANITTLADLICKNEREILAIPHLGRKSFLEIKDSLLEKKLHFGMDPSGVINNDKKEKIENNFDDEIVDIRILGLLRNTPFISNDWIDSIHNEIPELAEILDLQEITSDSAYIVRRYKLDTKAILSIDNFRFEKYITSVNIDLYDPIALLGILPKWLLEMDISYVYCCVRVKKFIESESITCLLDLTKYTSSSLLKIPNFGRNSLQSLSKAILVSLEKGPPPTDALYDQNPESLKEAVNRTFKKIDNPKHLSIIKSRLGFTGKPKTLEELGQELGYTRERIRQIQKKITLQILDSEYWDDILRMKLNKLFTAREAPLFLDLLPQEDPWFAGFEDNLDILERIIITFSESDTLNSLKISNRKVICHVSDQAWHDAKYDLLNMLEQSLELNHTLEDVELFLNSKLEKLNAGELTSLLFEEISKNLNFSNIDNELVLVSVGNSLKSHLIALLETVESPQHFESIAKLYEAKYGIPISERYVHACLVNKDFYLFGRGTYGLKKHLKISPERQNQIMAAIEDEISKHNPHRQWHASDLYQLVSVDAENDLNKYAINIILRSSNKLRYLGKSTWKLKVDGDEATERKYIKSAVYDALKQAGRALNVQELEEIVSTTRGTSEFFSINLQPNELFSRLDTATWGLLERDFILSPQEWLPIKNKLYEIFTATGRGIHKTELLSVLNDCALPPEIEDNHILGVIATDNRFKAWHSGYVGLASWNDSGRKSFAQVMKEIADNTLTSITLDEVIAKAESMLKFKFNRSSVSAYLNKYGLAFDRDENLWKRTGLESVDNHL